MFQMLGIFAEFEGSMIVARVHAGLARATKTGPQPLTAQFQNLSLHRAFGRPNGLPDLVDTQDRQATEVRYRHGAADRGTAFSLTADQSLRVSGRSFNNGGNRPKPVP